MLADDIAAALPELRRHAESRMLDTAEIRRPTGNTVFDEETGTSIPEVLPVFTTRCRVKSTRTYGVLNQEVGGRTAQTVAREFHMPVDSPAVEPGDVAVLVAIHETTDPSLLGAELTLSGPAPGSQTTARRIEVLEVVA